MEGIAEELIKTGNEEQDVAEGKSKRTSSNKGNIMVTIRPREGMYLQKKT